MPLIASTSSHDILYGLGLTAALIIGTKTVAYQLRRVVELNEIHVEADAPASSEPASSTTTKKVPKELPLKTLETLLNNPSYEIRDAATKLLLPRFLASSDARARLAALHNPSTNSDEESREDAQHMVMTLGPALRERKGDEDIDILEALGTGPDNEEIIALWEEVVGEAHDTVETNDTVFNVNGRRRALEPTHPLMAIMRAQVERLSRQSALQAEESGSPESPESQEEGTGDGDELVVVMQRGEDNGVTFNATTADALRNRSVPIDDGTTNRETVIEEDGYQTSSPDSDNLANHTASTPLPPTTRGRWVLHEQNEEMWLEREGPQSPPPADPHATASSAQPHSSRNPSASNHTVAAPTRSRGRSPSPDPAFMPDYNVPPRIPNPPFVYNSMPQASLLTATGIDRQTITLYNEDGFVVGQHERNMWEREHGDAWRRMRERTRTVSMAQGRRGNARGFRRGGGIRRRRQASSGVVADEAWGDGTNDVQRTQGAANQEGEEVTRGWGAGAEQASQGNVGQSHTSRLQRQRRREAIVVGSSIAEFEAQLEGDGWGD